MSRIVTVGAAQLGPIARTESRAQAVARMIALMRQAASHGCDLVVFPECALTAFFPHWYYDRQDDIDAYFEREMPNAATQPLFDCARELGRSASTSGLRSWRSKDGVTRHFNTSILVDKAGRIVGKYRKVHCPGHTDHRAATIRFRTWNSGTSRSAICRSSARGGPSAACDGHVLSATTAAGPRRTACWPCWAAARWCCSGTTRPTTFPSIPRV